MSEKLTTFYAAINTDDLQLSGVFATNNIRDVLSINCKDEVGFLEGHNYVFLPCHSKYDAQVRVRIEILERTQANYSLLHYEKAKFHGDYELASLMKNTDWMEESLELVNSCSKDIMAIEQLKNMAIKDLTRRDLFKGYGHSKSGAINDNIYTIANV